MFMSTLKTQDRNDERPLWEPCLRSVVAETLGLDSPDALCGSSLVDDLAADSLDLVEIACAVEESLGVPIDTHAVQGICSYEDLVTVVTNRLGATGCHLTEGTFSACCIPASGESCVLVRSGALVPYDVALLEEDCRALGEGSRLQVRASSPEPRTRRWLNHHLDRLRRVGVDVVVSWARQQAPALTW